MKTRSIHNLGRAAKPMVAERDGRESYSKGLRSPSCRIVIAFLTLVALLLTFPCDAVSEKDMLWEAETDAQHNLVWGYIPDMVDMEGLHEFSSQSCLNSLLHLCRYETARIRVNVQDEMPKLRLLTMGWSGSSNASCCMRQLTLPNAEATNKPRCNIQAEHELKHPSVDDPEK